MKSKALKITILTCVSIALLTLLTNIFALQITQPQVELQVRNEGEEERMQAFTKALEQILTQNSGNPKITIQAPIKAALSNPSIYVQSYTYVTNQQAVFLRVQFDQAAIKQLLQQTTKPGQKPDQKQILVWLAKVAAPGNKTIENESSNDVIIPVLKKNAQDFGASIMFPISDLQDASSIKADDICNSNAVIIKDASQRYGSRIIVAGCIKEPTVGNMWISQWLLLRDGKNDIFNFSGSTIDNVIRQAISAITLNITDTSNKPKKLILRITNVSGLDQYNEVIQYLSTAFGQTTQMDLIKISPIGVELGVNTRSDKQALITMLDTQKNKLVRSSDVAPVGIDLDYKLVTTSNEQPQTISAKPVP
jgi:hypothetical protein